MGQFFPGVQFSPPQFFSLSMFMKIQCTHQMPQTLNYQKCFVKAAVQNSYRRPKAHLEAGSHNLPLNLFHLLHMNSTC